MTVSGGKGIRRSVMKLKQNLDREVNDAVDDSLDGVERLAKRKIVENDAVATATLYHSFMKGVTDEVVSGSAARRHTLTNAARHAKFVEWGTGDYFAQGASWGFEVPVNPYGAPSFSMDLIYNIKAWIIMKPGFYGSSNPGPGRGQAVDIARSISTRTRSDPLVGTAPQPFMRPAWFMRKPQLKLNVRYGVKKAVRRA